MTEQTNQEATAAYFDLHRRHERLLAAVVGLRDTYRASAARHDRLGPADEPFKHAAWANRADDLDRVLAAPAVPVGVQPGGDSWYEDEERAKADQAPVHFHDVGHGDFCDDADQRLFAQLHGSVTCPKCRHRLRLPAVTPEAAARTRAILDDDTWGLV